MAQAWPSLATRTANPQSHPVLSYQGSSVRGLLRLLLGHRRPLPMPLLPVSRHTRHFGEGHPGWWLCAPQEHSLHLRVPRTPQHSRAGLLGCSPCPKGLPHTLSCHDLFVPQCPQACSEAKSPRQLILKAPGLVGDIIHLNSLPGISAKPTRAGPADPLQALTRTPHLGPRLGSLLCPELAKPTPLPHLCLRFPLQDALSRSLCLAKYIPSFGPWSKRHLLREATSVPPV